MYIGNMPSGVREKDLERFFKKFGRPNDFLVKQGFGFVEFDDYRDADDAVYELNGKVSTCITIVFLQWIVYCVQELLGQRVSVEHARGTRRDRSPRRYLPFYYRHKRNKI